MKPSILNSIRLNWHYLFTGIILLLIEIFIGACLHDPFIRPYMGDFLVVMLLFCLVKAFFDIPVIPVALALLLFSYLVEWTQYLQLADHLHLGPHSPVRILIGDYFTWTDMLCYTFGIISVIAFDRVRINSCFNC